MRIICPRCATEYVLDAALIDPAGTPVQCSACEHTFAVHPEPRLKDPPPWQAEPGATTAPHPAAPPSLQAPESSPELAATPDASPEPVTTPGSQAPAAPVAPPAPADTTDASGEIEPPPVASSPRRGEPMPPFMVGGTPLPLASTGDLPRRAVSTPGSAVPAPPPRSRSGPKSPAPGRSARLFLAQGDRVYKVKGIATLQRWIVEKRVLPEDRMSLDGKTWETVSERVDLRAFFAVLDQLKATKRALQEAQRGSGPFSAPPPRVSRSAALGIASPAAVAAGISQRVTPPAIPNAGLDDAVARLKAKVESGSAPVSATAPTPTGTLPAVPDSAVMPPTPPPPGEVSPPDGEHSMSPPTQPMRAVPAAAVEDTFFGPGVTSGGDEAGSDVPLPPGAADTRPVAARGEAQTGGHKAAEAPLGSLESAVSIPNLPAVRSQRPADRSGSIPRPDLAQSMPDLRPEEHYGGAGGGFWTMLLFVATFGVAAAWYFLLGPGRGPEPAPTSGRLSTAAESAVAEVGPTATPTPAPTSTPTPMPEAPPAATPTPTPPIASAPPVAVAERPSPTPAPRAEPTPSPVSPEPARSAEDAVKQGDRARERGDFASAADAYLKALATDPSHYKAALQLGWSYIELGRNRDAIDAFQKAAARRPGAAEPHYGLGLAHDQLGQVDNARTEYQRVIDLDPGGRDTAEVRALLEQLR